MTSESQGSGFGSFLGAFALGAAAGATIALLTAPRSGRETLKGTLADLGETIERAPDAIRGAGSRAVKAGQAAFEQARGEVTRSSDHS